MSVEEEKHVWNMIDYVEGQVEHGMRIGADLQEVANMLAGAKMMMEGGLTQEAANMVEVAQELASYTLRHHKLLITTIRRGKKMMDEIVNNGGVVDDHIILMQKAEEALERADLKAGVDHAMKCINCLEEYRLTMKGPEGPKLNK
ncbi:MAG: hypothetical protein KAS16_07600 [Thermoplasmata archaeon]|nr:hypothetical protein [Thermoplasmata archaeon]